MSLAVRKPEPSKRGDGGLFTFFDRTYVVNLPERKDRRQAIERELRATGGVGEARFFAGIRPTEANGFPSVGAYGCFLSHHALLREAVAAGVERLLVLEDDLTFASGLSTLWPKVEAELERVPWDLAYFGYDPRDVAGEGSAADVLTRCFRPMQLGHFYAVQGRALPELVAFLDVVRSREPGDPRGGPMHYDGALSTFRAQNPEVRTVRSSTLLGWQRPSRSDIAPNAWFDRVPGVSAVVGALRGVKGRMMRPKV